VPLVVEDGRGKGKEGRCEGEHPVDKEIEGPLVVEGGGGKPKGKGSWR
jgi:hypothetical protein